MHVEAVRRRPEVPCLRRVPGRAWKRGMAAGVQPQTWKTTSTSMGTIGSFLNFCVYVVIMWWHSTAPAFSIFRSPSASHFPPDSGPQQALAATGGSAPSGSPSGVRGPWTTTTHSTPLCARLSMARIRHPHMRDRSARGPEPVASHRRPRVPKPPAPWAGGDRRYPAPQVPIPRHWAVSRAFTLPIQGRPYCAISQALRM